MFRSATATLGVVMGLLILQPGCAARADSANETDWRVSQVRYLSTIQGAETITEIFYASPGGEQIRILTNARKFTRDQKPLPGPSEPNPQPQWVIYDGWIYVYGPHVSAGTQSHSIAAEGSKLIVNAQPGERKPHLIHLQDDGTSTAKAWVVGAGTTVNLPQSQKIPGQDGSPPTLGNAQSLGSADLQLIESITEHCAELGWPKKTWPSSEITFGAAE